MSLDFSYPEDIVSAVDGMTDEELMDINNFFTPRIVDPYFKQTPTPAQQLALSLNDKELFWGGAAGGGKSSYLLMAALQYALALDTLVPTPNGWSTIGELKVGDTLYGPDGRQTKVVHVTDVFQGDCYSVTFKNGESVIADGDHIWDVTSFRERLTQLPLYRGERLTGGLRSTRDMYEDQRYYTKDGKSRSNWSVKRTKATENSNTVQEFDPYLLGVWLAGNGNAHSGVISSMSGDNLRQAFVDKGFKCTPYRKNKFTVSYLTRALQSAGITDDGLIPTKYLRGSVDQRSRLLWGIMDAAGKVTADGIKVSLTHHKKYVVDITQELLASLGFNPIVVHEAPSFPTMENTRPYTVSVNCNVHVFTLQRAVVKQSFNSINHLLIRSITKVPSVPVKCITVDNDSHQFLITKSWLPTHNCDIPGYSALLLRRTWPDLNAPGALLDRMRDLMADTDAKPKEQGRLWVFPSGAKISFGYAQRVADKDKYASAEYQFIGFDEATHFEGELYTFMQSRLRKPSIGCMNCQQELDRRISDKGLVYYRHKNKIIKCPTAVPDPQVLERYGPAPDGTTIFDVPLRIRAASNPGSIGHEFFKARFVSDETRLPGAVFIPASLQDNPFVNREEYAKNLEGLNAVDRERLLNGDWEVMPQGNMFQSGQFRMWEGREPSEYKHLIRFWDLAASTGEKSDYTVGALCGITYDNEWVIIDIKRAKLLPHGVEALVLATAKEDEEVWGRTKVAIRMEQEPGSAGKNNISNYTRNILAGFRFKGVRSTGSKTVRAEIVAGQAGIGNVYYLNRPKWNKDMLDEFAGFPNYPHDDQVDAVCGAFNDVFEKRRVKIIL